MSLRDLVRQLPPVNPRRLRRNIMVQVVVAAIGLILIPWQIMVAPIIGVAVGTWLRVRWDREQQEELRRLD